MWRANPTEMRQAVAKARKLLPQLVKAAERRPDVPEFVEIARSLESQVEVLDKKSVTDVFTSGELGRLQMACDHGEFLLNVIS
jgi:hypothetical protein